MHSWSHCPWFIVFACWIGPSRKHFTKLHASTIRHEEWRPKKIPAEHEETCPDCVNKAFLTSSMCPKHSTLLTLPTRKWSHLLFKNYPGLFIYFFLFYFWLRWVFVAAWSFSSCSEWGLLFVAVHGLLTVVASCCRAPALSRVHGIQYLWPTALVSPWHVESSQSRDWTCVSYIGRRILSHLTTREGTSHLLLNSHNACFFQSWGMILILSCALLPLVCEGFPVCLLQVPSWYLHLARAQRINVWHFSVLFHHSVVSDYLQPHGLCDPQEAHQASLSITNSQSLLKLISIEFG